MKKLIFAFPIVLLLATACNKTATVSMTTPSTGETNQATNINAAAAQSTVTAPTTTTQTTPNTVNTPAGTVPTGHTLSSSSSTDRTTVNNVATEEDWMQSYYNQNKKCPSSQEFTQKFPKPTGAYYPAYSNELPSDCSIVYYLLSERSYAIGTLVKESVGNFNSGQIEYYVVITP